MRVLVTGANGFIGRHITAALLAAGHDPVAVVRGVIEMQRVFPSLTILSGSIFGDSILFFEPARTDQPAKVAINSILSPTIPDPAVSLIL